MKRRRKYNGFKDKDTLHRYQRSYHRRWKNIVLEGLGGKCQYPGCVWTDFRALQIDHINEDFKKIDPYVYSYQSKNNVVLHTYRSGMTKGQAEYILNHPEYYQLLCSNHNQIKEYERRKSLHEESNEETTLPPEAKETERVSDSLL